MRLDRRWEGEIFCGAAPEVGAENPKTTSIWALEHHHNIERAFNLFRMMMTMMMMMFCQGLVFVKFAAELWQWTRSGKLNCSGLLSDFREAEVSARHPDEIEWQRAPQLCWDCRPQHISRINNPAAHMHAHTHTRVRARANTTSEPMGLSVRITKWAFQYTAKPSRRLAAGYVTAARWMMFSTSAQRLLTRRFLCAPSTPLPVPLFTHCALGGNVTQLW